MMRTAAVIVLFVFLLSCQGDLPPSPPPPGAYQYAGGQAIGGISLPSGALPSWAAQIQNTDIDPATVKDGQVVKVTVQKPQGLTQKFYVHGVMHTFNKKSRVWERVSVDPTQSGKVAQSWVEDKGVFFFTADKSKFDSGLNYLITYYCIDTGSRDQNQNKVWDCNGNKWGLGAVDFRVGFPELVEQDLQSYKYDRSNVTQTSDGQEFEAKYIGPSGSVPVKVLKLSNATAHKKLLAQNLLLLEPIWKTVAGVCGFVQQEPVSGTTMTWISNQTRVTVQTVLGDDARITAYAQKYPADCRIVDELRRIAAGLEGYCGNNKLEPTVEQCDGNIDSACPSVCKPDCTCAIKGDPGVGICGDFAIQQPNKDNMVETCEPPMTRDIVTGQVKSGSLCFVRDPVSQATTQGYCDTQCKCIAGNLILPKCGNGVCDQGETPQSCSLDCPRDTQLPVLAAVIPQSNQSLQSPLSIVVDARDAFGVTFCSVKFDGGAAEQLNKNATAYSLLNKTLAVGERSAQFTCGDAAGNNATLTVPFTIAPLPAP